MATPDLHHQQTSEALLAAAFEAAERNDGVTALKLFNQALALRPGWQRALYAKACTLFEMGDASLALATLEQIDPAYGEQDGVVWAYKGKIYLANKYYQAALECSERAIACKPLFAYWKEKAEALEGLGRHQEALTARAEFYYRWGLLAFQRIMHGQGNRHDQEEALQMFDLAIAADPHFLPALRDKAIILARIDQHLNEE